MVGIFQKFEQIALGLNGDSLVGLGLVFVLTGLFAWLGGLSYKNALIAIFSAVGGAAFCYYVLSKDIGAMVIAAGTGMVLVLLAERIFRAIVGQLPFFWYIISAIFYAAAGSVLIFAGMILLLLNKGADPVGCIGRRPDYYTVVLAAMIVFGTIEQLICCRKSNKPHQVKKAVKG